MPTPRQPPVSSAAKQARLPDGSEESTPLLVPSLPPPAYPDIMPSNSKDTTAGPSRSQAENDQGPSKDLESAGVHYPAVHLHPRPNRPWSRGKVLRLLFIALAHAVLIWLILTAAWGRTSKKVFVRDTLRLHHR